MRLLAVWVRLRQAALQILTHAHHARIITCRTVYLRALRASLEFIETTRSAFTGVGSVPVAISDCSTLQRLLAWVDPGERRRLRLLL